jgi:hypothetical protein
MQADVVIPEGDLEIFREALSADTGLRIGTARSRGLGRCTIKHFAPADDPLPLLSDRIEAFNEAWSASCEGRGHEAEGGLLVALTLETPALFVDDFLRPNLSPRGADLLQAAEVDEEAVADVLAQLEPAHQIARPTTVQSWNGLARFPHSSAQGLDAGSVIVFRAAALESDMLEALRHIEASGIGLRRHFGFGRVRVCHPIHTRLHEHSTVAPRAK